jgi:hypothetical protein
MNLSEACSKLAEHDVKTASLLEELYTLQGFGEEDSFITYISYVKDNTKEWYKKTLPSFKSESSASKLKTLVNNMLNPVKYNNALACLVTEADRVLVSARLTQTLKELVSEGHFKARPKRAQVETEDSDDDVSVEPSSEDGSMLISRQPPAVESVDLANKLAIAKRLLLVILDATPPDESIKAIARNLVETFL